MAEKIRRTIIDIVLLFLLIMALVGYVVAELKPIVNVVVCEDKFPIYDNTWVARHPAVSVKYETWIKNHGEIK